MSEIRKKLERRAKIRKGIRSRVFGTPEKPRLSVFRSNKDIYAQLIDDVHGKTIASASSKNLKDKATKIEKSAIVGKELAEKAKAAGVNTCIFDRNGYLYHGRVKSLAEGAREGGLQF
ncbi:MAG: 50S ribosomal protein L18 [Bacteroidota bacterium]